LTFIVNSGIIFLENIFSSYFKKGENMSEQNKILYKFGDLVRQRLEIIASNRKDYLIIDPHAEHCNSIVFNALHKVEGSEIFEEVFVEVSRLSAGFSMQNRTILMLGNSQSLPKYKFYLVDERGIYFGVIYEKIFKVMAFERYLWHNHDQIVHFFSALKLLIEDLHEQSVILPLNWRNEEVVYVGENKLPVFIGYNDLIPWNEEEYLAECALDWLAFLNLIADWEQFVPQEHFSRLGMIKNRVVDKIQQTAVA
jgi:hypothetical protein